MVPVILLVILFIFVLILLAKTIRVIPQGRAGIVERLGKFRTVLEPGLHMVVPIIDRVLPLIDVREQVVSFPSQSVITEDNLVVGIDTVVYFQVTSPKDATYEITNYIRAVDELTSATLRNVVGGLNLEQTLTSRDQINAELRGVLDATTGRWGLRVSRVDIKEIQPPHSIQDSMEKQMRAERDRRAAILTAEGQKQSDILTAEGESRAAILRAEAEKQAQILRAEGDAQSAILRADGEAEAVHKVFEAIINLTRANSYSPISICKPCPNLLTVKLINSGLSPQNLAMLYEVLVTHSAICRYRTLTMDRQKQRIQSLILLRTHLKDMASIVKIV